MSIEMHCPNCGAAEEHPTDGGIQLRVNKVHMEDNWHSQCLVCSGGYDKVNGKFTEANHNVNKGWFITADGAEWK